MCTPRIPMRSSSMEAEQPSEGCVEGCFRILWRHHKATATTYTTTKMSRSNFVAATSASFFPNTHFTNHESLPSLEDAYAVFLQVYPQYADTEHADEIKENEYNHLSNHICLDYTGIGLFSHAQVHSSSTASSFSSISPPPLPLWPPSFSISYKSASLRSELVVCGNRESSLESAIRRRITRFINVSPEDYDMVYTANRISAFKLLAESYPFQTNKRLLTVYDYESEAVNAMTESSYKRDARVMSASFSWPTLRINSARLKKMLVSKRNKNKGLFVFPLQSKISGARYSYLWMSIAQENGWHVALDACALGPKDMDTLGLSLFKPDFIICSFYKIFGENPSGFGCLFVKKSSSAVLETSPVAKSIGIVSIVPANLLYNSGTDSDSQIGRSQTLEDDDVDDTTRSFSAPISVHPTLEHRNSEFYVGETSETPQERDLDLDLGGEAPSPEITEPKSIVDQRLPMTKDIECASLDHADSLGLVHISCRQRCIINWLVVAITKLKHPHTGNAHSLVKIYGPKVRFDRGSTMAFNVFDWRGEKIEPTLVQKLADRSNISLSYSFLHNISFSDKYEGERDQVMEKRMNETTPDTHKTKQSIHFGIAVVTISLGFLAGFEQGYKLWAFIAKFLDADFVEKERWRYTALNQKMVQV